MSRSKIVDGMPIPSRRVRVIKGIVLVIICALVIVPFLGIVSTSLAPASQLTKAGGFVMLPSKIDFSAYMSILGGGVVARSLVVSVLVTLVGTVLSLLVTSMLAWSLSRRGTVGNRVMILTVLFTLFVTPGIIPTFLVVKDAGLINSYWSLIVPTMLSGFNVIVLRSFFAGIPGELIDAAEIDGAGEWRLFWNLGIPLSRASLAVVGLFYAVGYWNSFFSAMLYLNNSAMWPLQLVLRTFVVNGSQLGASDLATSVDAQPPQAAVQMAILVISILPILIVYPFLQRNFSKGMLTGAVKG